MQKKRPRRTPRAPRPAETTVSAGSPGFVLLSAGIALACLAIRIPSIGALPIFNDEAIFLRWGQLIAAHPSSLFLVPLADPRPPVHPGLLAILMGAGADPLLSGRLLSAVAGAATVFFGALLLRELSGTRAALAAAVLLTLSPYLAFHQRLATSEALFVLESAAAVWLALRFPRDGIWPLAATMALTLGTRLVLSLLLWPLLLACVPAGTRRRFAAACTLAFVLWSPYLLAHPSRYEGTPLLELRTRILYHPNSGGMAMSLERTAGNCRKAAEWLWWYLTPPLCIAAAVACVGMAMSRNRRILLILLSWLALMTVPLILFAASAYSRYMVSAAAPLLLLVACGLATLPRRLAARLRGVLARAPAPEVWLQDTDRSGQRLTAQDRGQYITGRPAGAATEEAIAWLRARAAQGRIALLTGDEWGVPADAVWLAFSGDPRVQLRHLRQGVPHDEKWWPGTAPSPPDPRLPLYRITRAGRSTAAPHAGQVDFRPFSRNHVVIVQQFLVDEVD